MPTATKTRRQKVQAMAEQTASPAEAEVAKALLAKVPEDRLAVIATDIVSIAHRSIEDEFAIGRLLAEAADILSPMARKRNKDGRQEGSEFSDWFNAQGFPFSMKTAKRLRVAVEREPEVRALIAAKTGRDMGVNTAVAQLMSGPSAAKPAPTFTMDEVSENHRTDGTFNRWQFATYNVLGRNVSDDDEATVTWTDRPFEHMHVDDLVEAADLIKRLVTAYQTEKTARAASA